MIKSEACCNAVKNDIITGVCLLLLDMELLGKKPTNIIFVITYFDRHVFKQKQKITKTKKIKENEQSEINTRLMSCFISI